MRVLLSLDFGKSHGKLDTLVICRLLYEFRSDFP